MKNVTTNEQQENGMTCASGGDDVTMATELVRSDCVRAERAVPYRGGHTHAYYNRNLKSITEHNVYPQYEAVLRCICAWDHLCRQAGRVDSHQGHECIE